MLHDIILKDKSSNALVGIYKVDISNDRTNIEQKQVSVNFFTKSETEDEDILKAQEKVERTIPPMNYLCQELVDKLDSIEVTATLDGIALTPTEVEETTTTTTEEETTTTTTEEG